jgi:hypothetical protein
MDENEWEQPEYEDMIVGRQNNQQYERKYSLYSKLEDIFTYLDTLLLICILT